VRAGDLHRLPGRHADQQPGAFATPLTDRRLVSWVEVVLLLSLVLRRSSLVRKKLRPAFTLLEVVLVLALIVVLAALAYPVFESLQAGPRLAAAADEIRGKLNECRTHAIEERRPYRFAFREGTG